MLHEFAFKKIKKSNNRNIYIFERDQNRNCNKNKKKKKYEIETYQFNRLNTIANKMVKKKKFQKI